MLKKALKLEKVDVGYNKLTEDEATQMLIPTKRPATLLRFDYEIRKGSVSDRLFHFVTANSSERRTFTVPRRSLRSDGLRWSGRRGRTSSKPVRDGARIWEI